MSPFTRVAACAAAILTWTIPAHAGALRGVLHVPPAASVSAAPNPYPGSVGALCGAHGARHGLATDAVVYVEGVPDSLAGPSAPEGPPPRLAQKDQTFVPRVVAVQQGGVVDFPNLDPIFHNVFSVSPTRRFDLGKYPKGHSKQVTFQKPGLVKVYCDIHSDMEAFVLVLPHRFFARPSADGVFSLPPLPAGRYQLKVWHPDLPELTREVEVPESGALDVSLEY